MQTAPSGCRSRGVRGEEAFKRLLHHPVLVNLPWVLEVPGYANEGPDEENVRALERLAGRGKRLVQVGNQIVAVLNPYGKANESIRDADLRPALGREARVRHGRW